MSKTDELTKKCLEIRRIWSGPGQHSHELAAAIREMFALLPDEGAALSIYAREGIGASATFGGNRG